jgi:hypothetical protein
MHADIKGSLKNINKCWRFFEHRGNPMTKIEVLSILKYAISKGYKTTAELSESEIDSLLS